MIKIILPSLFTLLSFVFTNAQTTGFNIPIEEADINAKNIACYYDSNNGQIIIDRQKNDSLTHFFYDSFFVLKNTYTVSAADRRLLYAISGTDKKKPNFIKNLSIQNTLFDVYASKDDMFIYKLDPGNAIDVKVAAIDLNARYKDEELLAVMPNENGCNFLAISRKHDIVSIYKWQFNSNQIDVTPVKLPYSTLSDAERKERDGTYLEVRYKDMFSNLSVNSIKHPDLFRFPSLSQLFYNDSCIYLINKIPNQMGINVFRINTDKGLINSKNYFINKLLSETAVADVAYPVATVYDTLLIMQNWSQKKLEYLFFNLNTENLLSKYQSRTKDSLYSLVHSGLRQVGTFGSESDEKNVENERLFMKRMSHGIMFMKPFVSKDSLILSFGSFIPTAGVEGLLISMASAGIGAGLVGMGFGMGRIGTNFFFHYLITQRNKFLYAYSKFSIAGLKPSTANDVRTYLDDILADKKMSQLRAESSISIECPGKLYIGIYDDKSMQVQISEYHQY